MPGKFDRDETRLKKMNREKFEDEFSKITMNFNTLRLNIVSKSDKWNTEFKENCDAYWNKNKKKISKEIAAMKNGPSGRDPESMLKWILKFPNVLVNSDIIKGYVADFPKEELDLADAWYTVFREDESKETFFGNGNPDDLMHWIEKYYDDFIAKSDAYFGRKAIIGKQENRPEDKTNEQKADIEELRGKYTPTRRRLKATSHTFSIIENIKNLSEASTNKVDAAARRMAQALEKINSLENELYEKNDEGKHPELTEERLKQLNSLYFDAMKECSAVMAGDGFSKSEKSSQKYKTYKKMATQVNMLLSLDTKSLGTANAKLGKTLPEVLSNSRGLVLDAGSVEFKSVGNAQSTRHPMSVTLGNGKKVKGVFTEKDDFDPLKEFNALFDFYKVDPEIEAFIDSLKLKQSDLDYRPDRSKMLEEWVNEQENKNPSEGLCEFIDAYRENPTKAVANKNYDIHIDQFNTEKWDPAIKRTGIGLLTELADDYSSRRKEYNNYSGSPMGPMQALEILSRKGKEELKKLPGFQKANEVLSKYDDDENMERIFAKKVSKFEIRTLHNYTASGITSGNLDTKNAACSVIASLLGCSRLIANSVTVKMKKGEKTIDGTFMELAEGTDLGYITSDRNMPENVPYYSLKLSDGINGRDVMNDIFDLEIFDQLVGNIDCHGGNIIYDIRKENDGSGDGKYYLNGIKRIDLDNTFIEVPVGEGISFLAGLDKMKVITKNMADRLRNLDGETLRFALRSYMKSETNPMGLSEKAMDCMVERLNDIKSRINYKSEVIKEGTLTVLDSEKIKSYKITDLTPEDLLGTSGSIVDAIDDKKTVTDYKKSAAPGSVQLSKGGNENTFSNVNVDTEEKDPEPVDYEKMEKELKRVKKGLDAVARVWNGSQQYADMNAKAGEILKMLQKRNENTSVSPEEFDQKLSDAILEFKRDTENYFVRKRGQGQEAANNKNSMKRIAAATDASEFIDDYIDKFAEKKISQQEKQKKNNGPLL